MEVNTLASPRLRLHEPPKSIVKANPPIHPSIRPWLSRREVF
jgi:hypothetical protein